MGGAKKKKKQLSSEKLKILQELLDLTSNQLQPVVFMINNVV